MTAVPLFFDTNIVVYAHDQRDSHRHKIASKLLRQGIVDGTAAVSSQVVQEFCSVALAKGHTGLSETDLELVLQDVLLPLVRHVPSTDFYARALALRRRYSLGWYDALIVQAAIDIGCPILYSEDLQAGQLLGGVRIVNPFDLPDGAE